MPAALTKADAERILASYWQVNNTANESRSDTLLKTVEAGSSYSMDAGTYQMGRVTDPANRQYTAFTAENATYYIPRQPAGRTRGGSSPGSPTPTWLLPSTRPEPGTCYSPRQPRTPRGRTTWNPTCCRAPRRAPFIKTDARGYAIAAGASGEAGLSVTSAQIQQATAESLEQLRHGQESRQPRRPARRSLLLGETASRINRHRQALGVRPGLRPADGRRWRPGVLRPHGAAHPGAPPGQTFQVSIPGFYSSSQTLTSATVGDAEQFATYLPPNQASPQVLADASGITGRE